MKVRKPRIPTTCPVGFQGRYVVVAGDTMYLIAERLGIPLAELIKANPHITNPNIIYPGDVLCVPFKLCFPCCVILSAVPADPPVPPDAKGTALIRLVNSGKQQSLSIMAVGLAPPGTYGSFDTYEGFINIPDIGGFGFLLYPTPEEPPAWAGTLIIGPFLTPTTTIAVRPASLNEGISGPVILSGTLVNCSC